MTSDEVARVQGIEAEQKAAAVAAAQRAAAGGVEEFDLGDELNADHVLADDPAAVARLERAAVAAAARSGGSAARPIALPAPSPPPDGAAALPKSKEQVAREEKAAAVYKKPRRAPGHTTRDCIDFEETSIREKPATACHDCTNDIPADEGKNLSRGSARCVTCYTVFCYDCVVARFAKEGRPLPTPERPFLRRLPPAPQALPRRVPSSAHLPSFLLASPQSLSRCVSVSAPLGLRFACSAISDWSSTRPLLHRFVLGVVTVALLVIAVIASLVTIAVGGLRMRSAVPVRLGRLEQSPLGGKH